ncbi:MAG: hypothetical protein LBR81_06870 [Prevotellaceae bacterium]|nr:hypothetical protein [Prevotellaceae bacterium]
MTKNRFWRNVVAIAIYLAGFTVFNACSDDDKEGGNGGNGGNGGPAVLPTQEQLNAAGISTAVPDMTGTLIASDYSEGITLKWSNSQELSYSAICTWLVGGNGYSYNDEYESATYLMYEAEKTVNSVSYVATVIYFMENTNLGQLSGKEGEVLLVIEQGEGGNVPDPDGGFGDYTLPENLKIVYKSANANDQTTVIKVGNDYYCTALKNSGLTNSLNYLRYDQATGTWNHYARTTGVVNSSWSDGEPVTAEAIESLLASGSFYGFVLTFGSYFNETGTDTYLSRPVTLYSNGGTTVSVDNQYGIVLKSSDTYGLQNKQVNEITTVADFSGIELPSN